MKEFLFSPVSTFSLNQNIYLCRDDEITPLGSADTWDLARSITTMCHINQIFNVKLAGNMDYLEAIEADIHEIETLNYSTNNIKVEMVGLN